ncbi:PfkB family carbohydrate kinase [Micropruina sp.]|uniref:PfkB family carbohydrate kinase n=1 Tax=Micropruina sp. TaxID=2737536 RepID=UPI0039E3216D
MGKQSSVLVIGEALVDVVHQRGQISEHVGGSPANVAFGLGRLEHDITLAAWFAKDERGERIAKACRDTGVKVAPGADRAPRTSVANAEIDAAGKATYQFDLSWLLPELPVAGSVGHVHTGSIGATLEPGGSQVVRALRANVDSATISYDPNARPTLMGSPGAVIGRVEEIIALADVVKSSDEDIEWLYPNRSVADVMRHWLNLGPALAVVTRGGDGAYVAIATDDAIVEVAPRRVAMIDTVGAGDSFMAGLISGLLDADYLGGPEAREALRAARLVDVMPAIDRAIGTSAITVSKAGAYAPTRAEL